MIGKLKGILTDIDGNVGLIETASGISFQVFLTPAIITHNKLGSKISFYTHLQVREDALTLFAFETKEQYQFFILLLSVSGVGPKTAYLVISYANIPDLIVAISDNNIDYFSSIRGLGKKTSMKIILELSQKLKQSFSLDKMSLSDDDKIVVDALVSLGFKPNEVKSILSKLSKTSSVEEKIQEALRLIK